MSQANIDQNEANVTSTGHEYSTPPDPMTAPHQALRDALEAGPTPGPWTQGAGDVFGTFVGHGPVVHTQTNRHEDAAYIAAADPSTIRDLLAERDALAAVAEALLAAWGRVQYVVYVEDRFEEDRLIEGGLTLDEPMHALRALSRPSLAPDPAPTEPLDDLHLYTVDGRTHCRCVAAYDRAVSKP